MEKLARGIGRIAGLPQVAHFSTDRPMNIFHPAAFESLGQARGARLRDVVYVAAAPAALAILEIFHPHPHNMLALDVRTWLVVHYLQVPLFALSAFAVAGLVRTRAGLSAWLCRWALFVFALCFVVFDTAAGLVVGSLVEAARASGRPDAWLAPIDAVWMHPILGGTNRPVLALIGRVALSIGTVAAAVSLLRAGRAWLPVLLLALSGCVMYVFPSHSWPGGPLTFGGLALAGAWLQWTRPRAARGQHKVWGRSGILRPGWRVVAQRQREAAGAVDGALLDARCVARDPSGAGAAIPGVPEQRSHERGRPGRRSG